MRYQLLIIINFFMICANKNEKTSLYKGVSWHRKAKQWRVQLSLKGEKTKNGGYFKDELDAGKRVNQMCVEFGFPPQNPAISAIPNQKYQKKEKTSQYKWVTWHKQRKKWCVQFKVKGEKFKYVGAFTDELDAAKRVNQHCEELGIPPQNPDLEEMPTQHYQNRKKASKYKGVIWNKRIKKWFVLIHQKGQKQKYGGTFNDELDAAKRVNQLCEEFRIPPQNPGIVEMPTQRDDYKTIDSAVISSEIVKTHNDETNKKKRKRKQEFNNDDKLPYFYAHWLN